MTSHVDRTTELLLVGLPASKATGQSLAFRTLIEDLTARGHPFDVVDISSADTDRRGGGFSWTRALEVLRRIPSFVVKLWRTRATVYLHLAQSRVGFLRDAVFIWPGSLFGRRVVAHLHGGNYDRFFAAQPSWMRRVIGATLMRVDKLVVESERLKKCFRPIVGESVPLAVVPNGLPMPEDAEFEPVAVEEGEPLRLLYLSNMIESKGYWTVLRACREAAEKGVDLECQFCGKFLSSPDDTMHPSAEAARRAFVEAISGYGLDGNVRWRGVVAGESKRDVLRWAHCMLLPSRYVNEGQPISLIEGLAFGKVLIASDHRAIPDMIDDGENGFLLGGDLLRDTVAAILWLERHRDRVRDMSVASRELFEERFSRENHMESLMAQLGSG